MTDLTTRLRDYRERFIFQGGSSYALQIADEIERLRTIAREAAEIATQHQAEVLRLRTELANVNNEFGSQTADWPDAWKRVAELKQHSNDRWREGERLRALNSSLTDKANAGTIANARLAEENARLRAALTGLYNVLRDRHYGRMPDEVQQAYDFACAALLEKI